jgi:hypothetical protein
LVTLNEDIDPRNCLVFGREGKVLAVGYRDGTVTLWDTAAGKAQAVLWGRGLTLLLGICAGQQAPRFRGRGAALRGEVRPLQGDALGPSHTDKAGRCDRPHARALLRGLDA